MAQKYFSAWTIHTETYAGAFQQALTDNQIDASDIVWRGPSGDAMVTSADDYLLDEEYAEYTEDGIVEDYLSEEV